MPVAVGSLIVMEEQPFAPEGEADVLVDESTGTDGHSALNLNFDFENGLDGWSGGGRLSGGAPLQWITDQKMFNREVVLCYSIVTSAVILT